MVTPEVAPAFADATVPADPVPSAGPAEEKPAKATMTEEAPAIQMHTPEYASASMAS